jgi:NAD(P)-dependent dehydrogenase (short-subunit alcohol dehydrogenase family)
MTFVERYGPWALVTGASAGIGAEFARQLSEMGLNLVVVARRRQRLEDLARDLESRNKVQVRMVTADLSQPDFLSTSMRRVTSIEGISKVLPSARHKTTTTRSDCICPVLNSRLHRAFQKYNLEERFEQRFMGYPCFVCSTIAAV